MEQQVCSVLAACDKLTGRTEPAPGVVESTPLDRATAAFRKLVTDVVNAQLEQVLVPLIAIRCELDRHRQMQASEDGELLELLARTVAGLDDVLSSMGIVRYEVQPGEPFDSLIHMAVDEVHQPEMEDGRIAQVLQAGFKWAQGRVIAPARVVVNRR